MTYLYNLLLIPIYYGILAYSFPNKYKRNKAFAIIVCIHTTLFRALANPYNYVDTEGYSEGFKVISKMSFSEAILSLNFYTHWGQGYLLFNWFIGRFTDDSTYLFILASFLAIIPVIWFYYKTSYKLLLVVLLYLTYPMLYYMGFGVLREHLAVPFVLLALYHIDKLKVSIPLAITGLLFHTSAIIFFPFYLVCRINFSPKYKMKLFSIILVIVIIMKMTMGYVLSFMPKYEEIVHGNESQNNIVPVILIGMVTFFISSQDFGKLCRRYLDIQKFIYYVLAISLFCIGIPGLGRLSIYFLYVIPVAISIYMVQCKMAVKKYLLLLSIALIYVRQIIYFLEVKSMDYSFFWEDKVVF